MSSKEFKIEDLTLEILEGVQKDAVVLLKRADSWLGGEGSSPETSEFDKALRIRVEYMKEGIERALSVLGEAIILYNAADTLKNDAPFIDGSHKKELGAVIGAGEEQAYRRLAEAIQNLWYFGLEGEKFHAMKFVDIVPW